MKYQYDGDLRYYSDVKDKFGYANIDKFPKDFDVKELSDHLNICDECGDIQNWEKEMYWQGDCADSWQDCMGDNVAVCDDCFNKLKKKERRV